MFRKKLAALVAAALMTLTASSAFAAFTNGELLMIVHDFAQNTEIVTDTGILAKNFSGSLTTTTDAANSGLNVTYFAVDTTTSSVWFTNSGTPTLVGRKGTNLTGSATIYSYYASLAATNGTVIADAKDPNSYSVKLDSGTTNVGSVASLVGSAFVGNTNASLAALASGGTVTQSLFKVASYAGTSAPAYTVAGTVTTAATSATPIPAAFYLMGSGLLGLVGLRRRNNA
jgi:hypothetical protein